MGPRVVHGHSIKESSTFGPLAPRLSQRPSSAAYGLGPSVFTIPANRTATDRASVSQAVACRGAPPLPPMSLGACWRCVRKQNSRAGVGNLGRARGAGPGPGGTWFAAGRGPAAGAKRRWGWPSCCPTIRSARKYRVPPDQPMELFRRGRPTPRALAGPAIMEARSEGREGRLIDGSAPVLVFLVLGLDDLKVELLDLGREGTDLAVRQGAPIHLDDGRDLGPGSAEEHLVAEIEL